MRALIWIIVLAVIVWGVWWFAGRDNAGIPATGGDTAGEVQGANDFYSASSTDDNSAAPSDNTDSNVPQYEGKG